jgi:hypothetical protein
MKAEKQTQEDVRQAGLEALARELGPVGMVRFLQQFETGKGDYGADRVRWLGKPSVRTLARKIKSQRLKQT